MESFSRDNEESTEDITSEFISARKVLNCKRRLFFKKARDFGKINACFFFFRDLPESLFFLVFAERKSFKIKSIKTRFFRRSKKTGSEADAKLSQSASDINTGKGLGSDEDLV